MSIIILRGFSHSGKDYIGQILCNNFSYKRFAFADSLKNMIQTDLKCSWEHLHTQEGKQQICNNDPHKRTYRQILIDEALRLRNIDNDIFAKDCCYAINKLKLEEPVQIVITDWRYSNELTILEQAFPRYKITPVHIQSTKQTKSPINDISEHQLDDRCYDYQLINQMNDTIYKDIELLITFINQS